MAPDGQIKIVRHGAYADMLRSYKIFVNDKAAGTLARNSDLSVAVPSGQIKIEARVDWGRSAPLVVNVAPGQTVTVEVSNRWGSLLSLWASTFGAQSYLKLEEVR
jgi:hypothetical protein